MIAYNRDWLDALLTKRAARKWHKKGLISDQQLEAIQEQFPENFYSPNVFIRIGLGLFCLILLLAAMGMIALILDPDSGTAFSFFGIFCGALCIAALDIWPKLSARHYGSGIDDMLLYVGISAIIAGICTLLPYNTPTLVYYAIAWPFLMAGSIRYLDRLMAVAAFLCSLFIVLLVVKDVPRLALYVLPFSGMLFSGAVYFFARSGQQRFDWRHWHGQLLVLELLALAFFYASGNYWIVQQAGADLFQLEQVPMAWFFWAFTFAVPVVYIVEGLRRKDRHLLDVGLGCIAAAVFTFRYYFHVVPLAWAGVIGGGVLFATAFFSIQYLRKNNGAFTYEEDTETSLLQEIEEQLIEQTIVNQPGSTPEKKESFGGGQFGGGGAGDTF